MARDAQTSLANLILNNNLHVLTLTEQICYTACRHYQRQ